MNVLFLPGSRESLFFRGPCGPCGPVMSYRNDFRGGIKPGGMGKLGGFLRVFGVF